MENLTSSKLFTTRQGTILLGVIAAVIAAIALIVYLNHYKNSANGSAAGVQVLVAKSLIQQGTPGSVIGTTGLYKVASIPKDQLKAGAFFDASSLNGQVAVANIYPSQQLTSSDFSAATNSLSEQLSKNQRAVVVPLGSPQQVGGQIAAGDHVDVWVAVGAVNHLVFQNMYVLGLTGGNVTLRANPRQSGVLISASQNGQIWLVLRPTVGTIRRVAPVSSPTAGG